VQELQVLGAVEAWFREVPSQGLPDYLPALQGAEIQPRLEETMQEIVFFDLETGGLFNDKHQVIQFGGIACEMAHGFPELERLEVKVQLVPGHYTQEALSMNSYDPEAWKDALPPLVAFEQIKAFFKRHATWERTSAKGYSYKVARPAGHNTSFDCDFLRAWADRAKGWIPAATWTGGYYDTIQLAKWVEIIKGKDFGLHKLEELCGLYGIEILAHDAMADTEATRRLAIALLEDLRHGNEAASTEARIAAMA